MKTYEQRARGDEPRRAHPWTTSTTDAAHRYHDLRAQPELIPTVLEDFTPWAAHAAVPAFYDLVAWLNGPGSGLETNDCAFTGPEANLDRAFTRRLVCTGRLGILFRDLVINTSARATDRLVRALHRRLAALDPDLALGVIGTSLLGVDYLALPAGVAAGTQVLISFWAWGDDEREVFANLARVVAALTIALREPVRV